MINSSLELDLTDHNYPKIRSMLNNNDLHVSVGEIIWSQNKLLSDIDVVLDDLNRRMRQVSNSEDIRVHFAESSPYSKIPKLPDYYRKVSDILVITLISLYDALEKAYHELLQMQVSHVVKGDDENDG